MLTKECQQCGKYFQVWDYRKHTAKYCSPKCRNDFIKSNHITKGKHYKEFIILKCLQCKEEFQVYPYRKNAKFCSKKCYGEWRTQNMKGKRHPRYKGKKIIVCKHCGKEFKICSTINQTYCSKNCHYEANKKERIELKCKNCGKLFNSLESKNRKFCSDQCFFEYNIGKNHHNWQGGISKLPYSFNFNTTLKEKIRKRDNYTCQLCGITEEEHLIVFGKALTVHHIDYNKQNCKEENLTALCIGCNSRVNFNRKYYKKYFKEKILKLARLIS
jgi:ribosomal protein L31